MNSKMKLTAMEKFQAALTTSPQQYTTNAALTTQAVATTDYIFSFNEADRKYDTSQYSSAGTFSATTTPWLNDITTVPSNWQWTTADTQGQTTRTAQVGVENSYIQASVPNQTYTGSLSDQIQQRYSKGIFETSSVFDPSQIDILTQNWINDDAEFARQRLGAANPDVIAKYTGSSADLSTLVGNSAGAANKSTLLTSLQQANGSGDLFICDYNPALANIQKNQFIQTNNKPDYMPNGFYFSVPIVFFTIDSSSGKDVLMPTAIQIDSVNSGYMFTPTDGENAWLLAKLWAASADQQWWFSGTHLYNTHSIDMIFGVGALNLLEQGQLDATHPMLILLYPHIQKVFNINNAVYNAAITADNPGGIYQPDSFCDGFLPTGRIGIYQLVNDLYQNYSFDDQAFDKTIAARGMDSTNFAGSFPYRDDGQVWWQAISGFVDSIVDATYASDSDVAADVQLNAWMKLVESAFNHDGVTRFTWTASIAYTKQAFTNLFFLTTVQHTAVNDSMFASWAFVPNGPFAMTAPPPATGAVSPDDVLNSLPDPQFKSTNGYAWPIQNQIDFVMNGTAEVTDLAAGDSTEASLHTMYPYDQTSQSGQYQAVTDFYNSLWTLPNSVNTQLAADQNTRVANFKAANPGAANIPNSVSYYYLSVKLDDSMYLNAPAMNCIQI
jgi:hypothetical protein